MVLMFDRFKHPEDRIKTGAGTGLLETKHVDSVSNSASQHRRVNRWLCDQTSDPQQDGQDMLKMTVDNGVILSVLSAPDLSTWAKCTDRPMWRTWNRPSVWLKETWGWHACWILRVGSPNNTYIIALIYAEMVRTISGSVWLCQKRKVQ